MVRVGTKQKVGNTRPSAVVHWCFTYNNYTEIAYADLINTFGTMAEEYVVGKEIGESGTPHLQGYVKFWKRERPMERIKDKNIHWERCNNITASIRYCQKDNNYVEKGLKIIEQIRVISKLYPWQEELRNRLLEPPDSRIVYWVYDQIGCTGKSEFCRYMIVHYNAAWSNLPKSADICMLADETQNIYLLDFPRTMENYSPYHAIESLKNGMIQDAKLKKKVRTIIMNPPHVVCFANWPPDLSKLSADRWRVVNLGDE